MDGKLTGRLSAVGGLRGTLSSASYIPQPYELSPATRETLGGVIVGNDLLITAEGVLSVDKATAVQQDNTRPITAAAVYAEVGNIQVLLETI